MCPIRTLDERPSIFIRDKSIFPPERMLHKDYYHKGSIKKKISVRGSQGDWPQDELMGGKPHVVSNFDFDFELLLSQLRVAVVRSEKLLAEAGDSSGTQRKGKVCSWKPLPSNS
jgi:hypothetical protein